MSSCVLSKFQNTHVEAFFCLRLEPFPAGGQSIEDNSRETSLQLQAHNDGQVQQRYTRK